MPLSRGVAHPILGKATAATEVAAVALGSMRLSYFLRMVKKVPGFRRKSVALLQMVAVTGEPSYCLVPGSVAEIVPETFTSTGWSAGHPVPVPTTWLVMLVSRKLAPSRNGAFQKIV